VQNLTTQASTIPDIIGAPKSKMGHMTLTTRILRVICHRYAGTWHSLRVYKMWQL